MDWLVVFTFTSKQWLIHHGVYYVIWWSSLTRVQLNLVTECLLFWYFDISSFLTQELGLQLNCYSSVQPKYLYWFKERKILTHFRRIVICNVRGYRISMITRLPDQKMIWKKLTLILGTSQNFDYFDYFKCFWVYFLSRNVFFFKVPSNVFTSFIWALLKKLNCTFWYVQKCVWGIDHLPTKMNDLLLKFL